MTHLNLTFNTRQELAGARSACRRLLASPLHLSNRQRDTIAATLRSLEAVADTTGTVLLDPDQQAALATALDRLGRHLTSTGIRTDNDNVVAVRALLGDVAAWSLPDPNVVQFVRLGYGDVHDLSVRSLTFSIDMPDRATFEACLTEGIGTYERFCGANVAAALGPMWDELSIVSVGRDSSPLIRLRIPFTRQQRNGGDNALAVPISDDERNAAIDVVCEAGRICRADAILFTGMNSSRRATAQRPAQPDRVSDVRLWWD